MSSPHPSVLLMAASGSEFASAAPLGELHTLDIVSALCFLATAAENASGEANARNFLAEAIPVAPAPASIAARVR